MACAASGDSGYINRNVGDGLMQEIVWGELLQDLYRENQTDNAQAMETRMLQRAQGWDFEPYPYGSEQPCDSTEQEGIYHWTRYGKNVPPMRILVSTTLQ
jgi:Family of unknown function (DUF5695)